MSETWGEAQQKVWNAHSRALLAFVRRICPSRGVAEDVFAEVWVRFSLKGQDAYRRGQALEWMFLTARRVAIDLSRKKKAGEPVDETQPARDRWGRKSDDPTQLHRMALAEADEQDDRVLGECLRKLEQTRPAHARLVRAMLAGTSQHEACAAEKFDMDKCYHVKSEAIKLLRLCVKGTAS